MKRKDFLKKSIVGTLASTLGVSAISKSNTNSDKAELEKVGYNHLPNKKQNIMKTTAEKVNTVIHKANTRGSADHGWLQSKHTFSFANYHNPERMHFGVLRVLNDDIVAESQGFGTHPHRDMEIISIPLEGDLKHEDNMGNKTIIKQGDIQVMSAGTGIMHSEYNANADEKVKFLHHRYIEASPSFHVHNKLQLRYRIYNIYDLGYFVREILPISKWMHTAIFQSIASTLSF